MSKTYFIRCKMLITPEELLQEEKLLRERSGENVVLLPEWAELVYPQTWIPALVKLPETRGKTLITADWGDDGRTVSYAYYWGKEHKWGLITENVVAWMPFPEPWEGLNG